MKNYSKFYLLMVLIFLYLPIIALVIFSFNSGTLPTLPWKGFTLNWYIKALKNESLLMSIRNSLIVASTTGVLAMIFGFFSSYFLRNWRSKFNLAYLGLVSLPAGTPLILLGFSLIMFFRQLDFSGSMGFIIVGHTVQTSPIALGIIRMYMLNFDTDIEEAARNLGASELEIFIKIIIPQSIPAMVIASSIAFLISWDEFIVAWFLSGFDSTLPVSIWSMLKSTINPQINAIGTISIIVSALFVILIFAFSPKVKSDKEQ